MDEIHARGADHISEFAADLRLLTLDQLHIDQNGDIADLNDLLARADRTDLEASDSVWDALQDKTKLVGVRVSLRQARIERLTGDESAAAA
jgi:hypothetical protein